MNEILRQISVYDKLHENDNEKKKKENDRVDDAEHKINNISSA